MEGEGVDCRALAQGDGKTTALGLLLLHRTKQPKVLMKDLQKQFPDAKDLHFGTAFVDVDENPKQVNFFINRPISNMARKLAQSLKGTGFREVQILLEDGTTVDVGAEEEEGEEEQRTPPPSEDDGGGDGTKSPAEDVEEEIPQIATYDGPTSPTLRPRPERAGRPVTRRKASRRRMRPRRRRTLATRRMRHRIRPRSRRR